MQARKSLVAAVVILAGALASSADAQSRGTTRTPKKKAAAAPSRAHRKAPALKSTAGARSIPPPPPILTGRSFGQSSSKLSTANLDTLFLGDPMGRMDLAGRPVPFYPSSRALSKGQTSPIREGKAPRPKPADHE
jgi:hypothetical protein